MSFEKRKLKIAIFCGLGGGLLFILIASSKSLIASFAIGAVIAFAFIAWGVYFLATNISSTKKYAHKCIEDGEIKNFVKAKKVIALLNVLEDTESKYLIVKMKEMMQKS